LKQKIVERTWLRPGFIYCGIAKYKTFFVSQKKF
jgi:hypothetical protein